MLCFDEARLPTDWEYQLADFGTQIASIAFERDRNRGLEQFESTFFGSKLSLGLLVCTP
jgi:hypothetical protein